MYRADEHDDLIESTVECVQFPRGRLLVVRRNFLWNMELNMNAIASLLADAYVSSLSSSLARFCTSMHCHRWCTETNLQLRRIVPDNCFHKIVPGGFWFQPVSTFLLRLSEPCPTLAYRFNCSNRSKIKWLSFQTCYRTFVYVQFASAQCWRDGKVIKK